MYPIRFCRIIFLCLFFFCSCIYEKEKGVEDIVNIGDRIPNFSVLDNNGNHVNSESLLGNVSFIVFFNTQCQDCVYELPICQQIYDKYKAGNILNFLCISREQSFVEVEAYWNEKSFTMPFSAQEDRVVYNLFANSGIPFVVIADKYGIIRFIYNDRDMPDYELLESNIELLANE